MPLSSSGDFAKSNDMNISVSTTSTSGYTLGIASSSGSTALTNQSDNTAKIASLIKDLQLKAVNFDAAMEEFNTNTSIDITSVEDTFKLDLAA